MDRSAFSRARSYLGFSPAAKWSAAAAGVAAAVLFALLVLVLGLLADLVITRGRVPTMAQLAVAEQDRVAAEWANLADDDRAEAAVHVGTPALADATPAVPVPARFTAEALKEWATERKLAADPYLAAAAENELRWRASVWHLLKSRVGREAADSVVPPVAGGRPDLPGVGAGDPAATASSASSSASATPGPARRWPGSPGGTRGRGPTPSRTAAT